MKVFHIILILCSLVLNSYAQKSGNAVANAEKQKQEATANETMGRLSISADQELAKSIQELNKLRDQITAEKLPLAQELTSLEEELTNLRKEYEKTTRLVDAGNLEMTTIKAEMKARQDELTYIANLLDEYARSFETKINISELQYIGKDIDTAKQASENTTLTMPEKSAKHTAFVNTTIKRLFDAVGGMRFPGVGVDMQGTVEEGQYALIGPVALFRSKSGNVSGLVIPQPGSTNPLIRPLEGEIQAKVASLVETGAGVMPLDPSRGGALKALVQKTDIVHIFKKGGPIMWPLLFSAVLSLLTVFERLFFLFLERCRRDQRMVENFFTALSHGNVEGAIQASRKSKYFLIRALNYALTHKEKSLSSALLYAQEREMKRYRRGIPILDTVITLAPLLGLLGTVTGMMGSFSLIGGDLGAPGAITGGIAEALIATAFGLGIAITSLIPFNFLNNKMEEARIEIETAATQLELLVHPTEIIKTEPMQDWFNESPAGGAFHA